MVIYNIVVAKNFEKWGCIRVYVYTCICVYVYTCIHPNKIKMKSFENIYIIIVAKVFTY